MNAECPPSARSGVIVFLHIPKTAGTTLNSILSRQYSPDELHEVMMRGMSWLVPRPTVVPRPLISFSKVRRLKAALGPGRKVRVVHGHFDFSIRGALPRDAQLFTFLRDPVERAVSHYYHYRRQTGDPIHPLAMRSTLAEWVGSCGLVEMDNGQTRRLAGEMNTPCGQVTLRMLERAKANLVAHFQVVGLTERFDESLVLLQRAFGWPIQGPAPRNVGNRPRRAELSADDIRAIDDRNRLDLSLYRFAAERFELAVSATGVKGELEAIKAGRVVPCAPDGLRPAAPRPRERAAQTAAAA